MTGHFADEVDVAVIGCGTTGLALARLLEFGGVRVALIDRGRLPLEFPRATHLDDETMRSFQTLGLQRLEETFSRVGVYRHYDAAWRPVMVMNLNQGLTDQGWQSDYMFHQPDFEAVLRGHAQNDANTLTFFGWEAVTLVDTGDAVTVTVREVSTGQTREIKAAYVVGCDGANSRVLGFMGGTQIDYNATHRSLIVDIFPFVSKEALAGRDAFIQGGIRNPLTFLAIAEPRLRWELMLRPDDNTADFERIERAYELISPWLSPDEYRILRSDVYEWRSLMADPWRAGRIFVAGDAAHTMPPHLGQGMCSGIRDAMNLGWKLPRVVRGESSVDLLDSYATERVDHLRPYIEISAQMANDIEMMEVVTASGDPGELAGGEELETIQLHTLRPRLGPGVRADDTDELAGTLSPQPRLKGGQLLDDVVGYRFVLVGDRSCVSAMSAASQELVMKLDVAVVDEDRGELAKWLGGTGAQAVVVRPDRYIYGAARSTSELDALLGRLDAALG